VQGHIHFLLNALLDGKYLFVVYFCLWDIFL